MRILLIIGFIALTGCASSGANGFCGRISGQGLTVPYVGGKAYVDGYNCHVAVSYTHLDVYKRQPIQRQVWK